MSHFEGENTPHSKEKLSRSSPESHLEDHAHMLQRVQSEMHELKMPGLKRQLTPNSQSKVIEVRTLKRGRSKSIVVPSASEPHSSKGRISRLNNYNSTMKKHRGSM